MGGSNTLRSAPVAGHDQIRGQALFSKGLIMHNWHPGMNSPLAQKQIEVKKDYNAFDSILAKNQ